MPSPDSLRRLANLTSKVRKDLRRGGMAINFKYLFRSTAVLARIVEVLADHVATQAENQRDASRDGHAADKAAQAAAPQTPPERKTPRRQTADSRAIDS